MKDRTAKTESAPKGADFVSETAKGASEMAVNLQKKKENLAVRSLELASFLVDIEARIEKNSKTHTNNTITYSAGDFDNLPGLQHVDPADMATLLSGLAALNAWLNEAGQFRMDIFFKVLDGA